MPDKYIARDATTGRTIEVTATTTGGTATQDGKIPALDNTGRLDPTLMPVGVTADVATFTALGALSAGDFVTIVPTGVQRASAAATGGGDADGFVLAAVANGASATVYFEGRNTALSGLTVGARYYLSDTTPGGITTTPVTGAGKRHQYLGKAITTSSLTFEADDSILLA